MKDVITLMAQPRMTDALAWSEDGVLAIACEDSLQILVSEANYGS